MRSLAAAILALSVVFSTATAAIAADPSYRVEVAGLACPFCAYGIEKKLSALEGVDRVETHIAEGAVIVIMKEGAELDEAAADRAVEKAGFTMGGFERVARGEER